MAVTYLRLFPAVNQFELRNGMLNVAGRLYVYYQGTDDLADIYDEDGRQLQQPAILDSDGRAPGLFVDSARVYWLKVCDRYDDQQYTVEKMVPSGGGAGSALGTEVSIVSTDGSLTIDENTSGGVKTFDIAVSEDSTQLLEWCKLSGLNTLDSDGDLAFSFASGNMSVEGGQLKLRDDSYYHVTTHFAVKPDAQGIGYDTLTFTLYKVDEDNNTLLLRTFTYDVDSSVSDMVEVEYSTDVMTEGELKVYWNVTGIADGIKVTIGDAQVHRVYSGIPRLPESTFATEEWVTDNFQPIGDYLSATESANYLLTSQSSLFQPSGDYLSATESSNYLLTSQSSLFQPSGDYQPSGNYLSSTDASAFYPSTANPSGYLTGLPADLVYSAELSAYQLTADMSGYIPTSESSNYYPTSNPSGFVTGVDLSNYATTAYVDSSVSGKLDASASGDFYLTSNPAGYITGVDLSPYQLTADMSAYAFESSNSAKLDASAFSSVSGTFLTAVPAGYATESYVDSAVSGKLDATASSQFITSLPADLATTADVASAVSGKMDQSASGEFYPMTGNPSGFLTAHQSLAGYATEQYVDSSVSGKLDSTAYDSAQFYLTSNPSGFITGVDLAPYQLTADMSGYLQTSESSNYYSTSNPSGFITGVDLSPYQTTAGMTAYQPSGDYIYASALGTGVI